MGAVYSTKLVLHIPHFMWENGVLVKIGYAGFCEALAERLNAEGVTDWYETMAKGRYKGRRYDQELWTVFCRNENAERILEVFRETFKAWNGVLRQAAMAYEHNGTLHVDQL